MATKRYGITPENMERARARMIASSGKGLTWKDFSNVSGVSQNTISNILNGRTNGSIRTARLIMAAAPKFNLVLHLEDLLSPLD